MEYPLALLVHASVPFSRQTSAIGRCFNEGDRFDDEAQILLRGGRARGGSHGRRCARVFRDGLRLALGGANASDPADAAVTTFQSAVVTNPATWTSLYGSWPGLRYDHGMAYDSDSETDRRVRRARCRERPALRRPVGVGHDEGLLESAHAGRLHAGVELSLRPLAAGDVLRHGPQEDGDVQRLAAGRRLLPPRSVGVGRRRADLDQPPVDDAAERALRRRGRLGQHARARGAVRWLRRGHRPPQRHLGVGQRHHDLDRPHAGGHEADAASQRADRVRLRARQDRPLQRQHRVRSVPPPERGSTRPGSGTGPRRRGPGSPRPPSPARNTPAATPAWPSTRCSTRSSSTTTGTTSGRSRRERRPVRAPGPTSRRWRPRSTPRCRATTTPASSTTPGGRCWWCSAARARDARCGS